MIDEGQNGTYKVLKECEIWRNVSDEMYCSLGACEMYLKNETIENSMTMKWLQRFAYIVRKFIISLKAPGSIW